MREMKDSGIDVVGAIPITWSLKRLKYLCYIQTGNEDTQNADPEGEYPFYVRSPIIEKCPRYTFDGEGILMAGDGAGAGRIFHHVYGKYAVHQRVYRLSNFTDVDTNYFYYQLSNIFPRIMDKGSAQSTVPSVRLPMLLNCEICLPPLSEQYCIASFLDTKCAEIDVLATDIQAQIDMLEQYKRSVITETVTKGLNSNVEMKDSGIAWAGAVPVKWKLSKIKYEIFPLQRPVFSDDLVMTCFRDGEVTLRQNRREDGFTISLTENGYQGVEKGDLVIHGMDAFAGSIGCADSRGKITPVVHVCRTTGNNRFFMYVLRSMAFNDVLMSFSEGIRVRSSDFRNFYKLGKFPIVVPPDNEQNDIVCYLDEKCEKIDAILKQEKERIDVLDAYKKSIIFEYVTGKQEVQFR